MKSREHARASAGDVSNPFVGRELALRYARAYPGRAQPSTGWIVMVK